MECLFVIICRSYNLFKMVCFGTPCIEVCFDVLVHSWCVQVLVSRSAVAPRCKSQHDRRSWCVATVRLRFSYNHLSTGQWWLEHLASPSSCRSYSQARPNCWPVRRHLSISLSSLSCINANKCSKYGYNKWIETAYNPFKTSVRLQTLDMWALFARTALRLCRPLTDL